MICANCLAAWAVAGLGADVATLCWNQWIDFCLCWKHFYIILKLCEDLTWQHFRIQHKDGENSCQPSKLRNKEFTFTVGSDAQSISETCRTRLQWFVWLCAKSFGAGQQQLASWACHWQLREIISVGCTTDGALPTIRWQAQCAHSHGWFVCRRENNTQSCTNSNLVKSYIIASIVFISYISNSMRS